MAAFVLGKRSRRAYVQEEVELTSPVKKRHTRRSTPQIYEDTSQSAQHASHAKVRVPVTRRIRTSKFNGQNDAPQHIHAKDPAPTADESTKENVAPTFSTPSATRFKDVVSSPFTPKHRVRIAGQLLTPRSNRTSGTPRSQSVYAAARQLFTQSSNPARLVGRDVERQQLTNFISNAISSRKGGCTYVSGPPGTGKSALVQEILEGFVGQDGIKTSTINCVTLRSSDQVMAKITEDLNFSPAKGRKLSRDTLSKEFNSKSGQTMHLVLLDEIDSLVDGDCELLYSMFEWALHPSSRLILIGIANALDLTDRFLPRLKTRNLKPQLLPFLPYTAKEMSDIIAQKLRSLLPANTTAATDFVPFLHPAAILLIGKKIASQTGDLRKAFNLTRRTIDQIEQETAQQMSVESSPAKQPLSELANLAKQPPPSPPKLSPLKASSPEAVHMPACSQLTVETAPHATISHVAKLASSIFNNGTVSRLAGLNLQQKAVLCSLLANERKRGERDPYKTPSKSTARILTVKDLFEKYAKLCQRDEGLLHPLKSTEFRDVIASLETLGLIHESTSRGSSLLTPSKTPSRGGKNPDDRQVVSAVSESEMRGSLIGAGGDLLQRLLDE